VTDVKILKPLFLAAFMLAPVAYGNETTEDESPELQSCYCHAECLYGVEEGGKPHYQTTMRVPCYWRQSIRVIKDRALMRMYNNHFKPEHGMEGLDMNVIRENTRIHCIMPRPTWED
jgi:hypothetical protein